MRCPQLMSYGPEKFEQQAPDQCVTLVLLEVKLERESKDVILRERSAGSRISFSSLMTTEQSSVFSLARCPCPSISIHLVP